MKKSSNNLSDKNSECIFCNTNGGIIMETDFAFAIFDKFPVSKGHSLIIPKKHISNYFELDDNEQGLIIKLVNRVKRIIDNKFKPDGYNIGINVGVSAGQTINHAHIHIIPRYKNDIQNPIGGVRNVIPLKGDYISKIK